MAPVQLLERMSELKADVYGGKYIADGAFVDDSDGHDNWFASHIYTQKPTAPNSPVEIHPRALTVRLPVTISPAAFDAAFDHQICKAAIDLFVQVPKGAAHSDALEVGRRSPRDTAYPLGSAARHSARQEIVVFRIREDSDRLVAIAEIIPPPSRRGSGDSGHREGRTFDSPERFNFVDLSKVPERRASERPKKSPFEGAFHGNRTDLWLRRRSLENLLFEGSYP